MDVDQRSTSSPPPASNESNKSNNSDQENTNETNQKASILRLVAIEKLLAPKSGSETEASAPTRGRSARAAATKNTSVIEITSSSAPTSDDEIIFVPKPRKAAVAARKTPKSSVDQEEVVEPKPSEADTSKPSSSRVSPERERGSLKMRLKIPKNVTISTSSDSEDSDQVLLRKRKSKHKSLKKPRRTRITDDEDEQEATTNNVAAASTNSDRDLDLQIEAANLRNFKIAVPKLPENLMDLKDDLQLEEICSFTGLPIDNLEKMKKLPNGKAAATSDSDSDLPVVKKKSGLHKKSSKMFSSSSKPKAIASSSESDEMLKPHKSKSSERATRPKATTSYAEADKSENDDSADSFEKPARSSRATKAKAVVASSDEEEEEEEEREEKTNSEESDVENKITKKSTVSKKRQRSESEASFDLNEDSDGSDSEVDKKKKKKGSSDDSDSDIKPASKKRRRIKKVNSSDEGSEKDSPNKGRKNIRKIVGKDNLEESTLRAAREERERKQRIEDRQKMYNQLYSEKPEEIAVLDKLVLDFDEKTKEVLIEVDRKLVTKLKPHQANGIKFMWDASFESLKRIEQNDGSGCILGHCMGLGKTLQVITLIHTLIMHQRKTGIERVLVVCPINIILNWVNEFKIWMKCVEKGKNSIEVFELSKFKKVIERAYKLNEWFEDGGVMIMGYDMYRILSNEVDKKRGNKKVKEFITKSLINPGPDLIICDEGHLLKNEKTSLSKAMNKVTTLRRIVLTGTPLQNNLKEYYCMVQFVKPNLLGKYQEYMNRFVNPITNGQYADSTEYDIKVMKRRSHVLHKMLDGCVQRRDYCVLAPYLPPKYEYILSIRLTKLQVELYKFYMENKARQMDNTKAKRANILFSDFQNLQRIWTHPRVLRYNSDRYEQNQAKKELEESDSEGSLKDFIDDNDDESAEDTPISSSDEDDSDVSVKSASKPKQSGRPRKTRAHGPAEVVPDLETLKQVDNPTEWWMPLVPEEELLNIEHSGKLLVLLAILEECEAIGDKLLVFSQSLYSLDVIEHFLGAIDEHTQTQTSDGKLKFTGSWSQGLDYFRLDGSTPVEQRSAACNMFNSEHNLRARLFLISTRAGGLGINLVAANRVVIFDVSWNPSHDIQSIFRVYRFGQTKPCYVYRFLALGTMEEKIYERQVTKQAISKRVLDEQQIDRHYHSNDIQELYTYNVDPSEPRPLPALPKDRLFADILKKFDVIYKYHEHDSLLENKEEETLDEEERKAAWADYEYEKNKPPPTFNTGNYVGYTLPPRVPGSAPVTSNLIFGIRSDILLKLLTLKARQDNPMFTNTEIQQYIPYLTQELYKQVQEGELTLRNELLRLQAMLEMPPQYAMSANGSYVPVNQMSNNLMMNPYAVNQMYGGAGSSGMSDAGTSQAILQQQQRMQLMQKAQSNLIRQAANKLVPITTIEID